MNNLDFNKRRTLKIVSAATAIGLAASSPVLAAMVQRQLAKGDILECKLISRSDISRAHLLMHNRSNIEVVVSTFKPQTISYHNSFLNLSKAFVEPVKIPANERIMVRLNADESRKGWDQSTALDMNASTQFLPQGTQVVNIKLLVIEGIAELDKQYMLSEFHSSCYLIEVA